MDFKFDEKIGHDAYQKMTAILIETEVIWMHRTTIPVAH